MKILEALLLAVLGFTQAETYSNPVLWNDLADLDVFRVNDTYYYSTSDKAHEKKLSELHSLHGHMSYCATKLLIQS